MVQPHPQFSCTTSRRFCEMAQILLNINHLTKVSSGFDQLMQNRQSRRHHESALMLRPSFAISQLKS
jgi:hypothetical protein